MSLLTIMYKAECREISQNDKDGCFQQALNSRKFHSAESIDSVGFNELHWAVLCNQKTRVEEIVKNKMADINRGTCQANPINMWNITPLMIATMHRYEPIVNYLLSNGAIPIISTQNFHSLVGVSDHSYHCAGENPIEMAARRKFDEITDLFSEHAKASGNEELKNVLNRAKIRADELEDGDCILI